MARKLNEITDDMWAKVNPKNKKLVEEYLDNSAHLSKETLKQYKSALRIFFWWVKDNCNDKFIIDIKSKDYMYYQNWLLKQGLSEAGIKLKRSAISAFNEYILLYYQEEYPMFRNFITKQIKVAETGFVYKKQPLTPQEYNKLCHELEVRGEWQKLAYVKFTYSTGCRRGESRQLLKEVVNYQPIVKPVKIRDESGKVEEMKATFYRTHEIRCKGKGKVGKIRRLQFDEEAMEAIKKWLEVRGYDECPFIFVTKYGGEIKQVAESTFNDWCSGLFADIVGRRVHPHLFRESRATNLVVHSGKSLETAQKLLGHNSTDTTLIYIVRDDEDDADDAFI